MEGRHNLCLNDSAAAAAQALLPRPGQVRPFSATEPAPCGEGVPSQVVLGRADPQRGGCRLSGQALPPLPAPAEQWRVSACVCVCPGGGGKAQGAGKAGGPLCPAARSLVNGGISDRDRWRAGSAWERGWDLVYGPCGPSHSSWAGVWGAVQTAEELGRGGSRTPATSAVLVPSQGQGRG